jgi:uncharacterized protein with PIN domain
VDRTVVLRVAEPLQLFLAPRLRGADVGVRGDGEASLGHVVESVGVPLVEVGALQADGVSVPAGARPRPGVPVAVVPVPRPQPMPMPAPRFVLDVHLGVLARRLRLLGLDTAYRNDADDDELVGQVLAERRLLLTQDRGLLKRKVLRDGGRWAAYVRGSRPDDQLADVLDRFRPPLDPLSRCVACNGVLADVAKADVVDRLPPGTRRRYDDFRLCATCGRVYWRGAHAQRLDRILAVAARQVRRDDARDA